MHRLCRLEEIGEDALLALDVAAASGGDARDRAGDTTDAVLLHRRGTRVRAWLNVCPHAGRRLDWAPGRFLRDGEHLVCAHHGAVFELDGGVCVSGPCRGQALVPLPVTVRDDNIWLTIPTTRLVRTPS